MIDFSSLNGKKYHTIVIDCPWRYGDRLPGPKRGAEKHYKTMSLEEIYDIPIDSVSEDNAHMYCWVTNNFIEAGFEALRRWGFTYKTMITWEKTTQDGRLYIGMGHYFRSVTEHVLFGVRGKQPSQVHNLPNLFRAPRTKHSEKPEEFYNMARLLSPGPRLDIFSRRALEGFDVWGDEAPV